jgi:hypothetical protein
MQIDPKTAGAFKRLYQREFGEEIDALKLATDIGYARYHCRLVLKNKRASMELQAITQRIRMRLRRATVIDPETLSPFDYGNYKLPR